MKTLLMPIGRISYKNKKDFLTKLMKTVTLPQFLTDEQIKKCIKLRTAKLICDQVILPNLIEINRKLGQENDPMYLAYMCEYVLSQGSK